MNIQKSGAVERSYIEPFDAQSLLAELEEWEGCLKDEPEIFQLLRTLNDGEKLEVVGGDLPLDPSDVSTAAPKGAAKARGVKR